MNQFELLVELKKLYPKWVTVRYILDKYPNSSNQGNMSCKFRKLLGTGFLEKKMTFSRDICGTVYESKKKISMWRLKQQYISSCI